MSTFTRYTYTIALLGIFTLPTQASTWTDEANHIETIIAYASNNDVDNLKKVVPKVNLNKRYNNNHPLFWYICMQISPRTPSKNIYTTLLQQVEDVNTQDEKGGTFLHYLYDYTGHLSLHVVQAFCDQGADLNLRNQYDITPFHAYTLTPYDLPEEDLALFLQQGADPNAKNILGSTPFSAFCATKIFTIASISLFLTHGGDPNLDDSIGITPFLVACM